MSEKQELLRDEEKKETTPRPSLLDVIKIDGRWAQVFLGGDTVKYLDDESVVDVEWDEYNYKPTECKHPAGGNRRVIRVGDLVESYQISPHEFAKIRWDGDTEKNYPAIKCSVTVFGEYTKK